jgi:uncharacterized Zn finger protein (UPF0148 family)
MGRYPRAARSAAIKCIACNAPVTETVDGEYVCVSCGDTPVRERIENASTAARADD